MPFSDPAEEFEYSGEEEDILESQWTNPSSRNLVRGFRVRGERDKPTFARRLLLVTYSQNDSEQFIRKHNDKICKALGLGATCVWHSSEIFAFVFLDQRDPQTIVDHMSRVLNEKTVYDAAVFRLASVLPEVGKPSPLEHFLSLD